METLNAISPRKMVNFLKDVITDDSLREDLKSNPETTLAKYNIEMPKGFDKSSINLPTKEEIREKVASYLKGEQFSFPATINAQAGFPLAFAITVIFVLIPTNISPQPKS